MLKQKSGESNVHTRIHPSKPKKFKQMLSAINLMTALFWDRKGVFMVEFMQQGTTVTPEVYCETQKNK
jgi:hypothetical protein